MLSTNIKETDNGNGIKRYNKEVVYSEPTRTNATATKKESIVAKYSESYQLNVMRKAILGDATAIADLQAIEDYISSL